jgi:putative colanic acid biosynthesis acetyltransferase WcaF
MKLRKCMEKELWFQRNENTRAGTTKSYKIKLLIWRSVDMLFFKTSPSILNFWRIFLLRMFGAKIGKGSYIAPRATILIPWNFEMGNFSSIDDYAFIKPSVKVIIGDYVSIANFVHVFSGGHDVRSRGFESDRQSINIGSGVFIGADTFIYQGVNICQMAVIGARSVVLKDIPENTIAFGCPCKVRSERLPKEEYEKYRFHYVRE